MSVLIFVCIIFAAADARPVFAASWSGVDETVIEKVAEEAGRSAREPLINTDQGDLLLFVFLVAGMVGGFIGGYNFRTLFPPKQRLKEEKNIGRKIDDLVTSPQTVTPVNPGSGSGTVAGNQ